MNAKNAVSYRDVAEQVAVLLLQHELIEKVGLYGSVARGDENPHDIDMFVVMSGHIPREWMESFWVDEKDFYAVTIDGNQNFLEDLGLLTRLTTLLNGIRIHVIPLPVDYDAEYVEWMATSCWDEDFWWNVCDDYLEYDPTTGHFESYDVPWADWVDVQLRLINGEP